jgi:hypothetical protein
MRQLFSSVMILLLSVPTLAGAQDAKQPDKPAKGLPDKPLPPGQQAVVDTLVHAERLLSPWIIDYDKPGLTFSPKDTFKCFGSTQGMAAADDSCLSPMVTPSTKALYVVHLTDWEDIDLEKEKNGEYTTSDPVYTPRYKVGSWYVFQYIDGSYRNIPPKGKTLPPIFSSTESVLISVTRLWRPKGDNNEAPYLTYKASASEKTGSQRRCILCPGSCNFECHAHRPKGPGYERFLCAKGKHARAICLSSSGTSSQHRPTARAV